MTIDTIKIKNLPVGYQSIITNGSHSIVGDEPLSQGGTDLGLSPSELILSGLALCKVASIRYYARLKGWELGEINAVLSKEVKRIPNQKVDTVILIGIRFEGNLTFEQRKELLTKADNCYMHTMIMGNWEIKPTFELESEL